MKNVMLTILVVLSAFLVGCNVNSRKDYIIGTRRLTTGVNVGSLVLKTRQVNFTIATGMWHSVHAADKCNSDILLYLLDPNLPEPDWTCLLDYAFEFLNWQEIYDISETEYKAFLYDHTLIGEEQDEEPPEDITDAQLLQERARFENAVIVFDQIFYSYYDPNSIGSWAQKAHEATRRKE